MLSQSDSSGERAGRREWWGLALLALPSMLLFMMLSILFLAIPHLAVDLRPSSVEMLWIIDIYGFLMAGFLVAMGTLGDSLGRRRLLIIGSAVFGAVSVIAAYTDDPRMMILWRAVLGIAAAAQMPAALGLIFAMTTTPTTTSPMRRPVARVDLARADDRVIGARGARGRAARIRQYR